MEPPSTRLITLADASHGDGLVTAESGGKPRLITLADANEGAVSVAMDPAINVASAPPGPARPGGPGRSVEHHRSRPSSSLPHHGQSHHSATYTDEEVHETTRIRARIDEIRTSIDGIRMCIPMRPTSTLRASRVHNMKLWAPRVPDPISIGRYDITVRGSHPHRLGLRGEPGSRSSVNTSMSTSTSMAVSTSRPASACSTHRTSLANPPTRPSSSLSNRSASTRTRPASAAGLRDSAELKRSSGLLNYYPGDSATARVSPYLVREDRSLAKKSLFEETMRSIFDLISSPGGLLEGQALLAALQAMGLEVREVQGEEVGWVDFAGFIETVRARGGARLGEGALTKAVNEIQKGLARAEARGVSSKRLKGFKTPLPRPPRNGASRASTSMGATMSFVDDGRVLVSRVPWHGGGGPPRLKRPSSAPPLRQAVVGVMASRGAGGGAGEDNGQDLPASRVSPAKSAGGLKGEEGALEASSQRSSPGSKEMLSPQREDLSMARRQAVSKRDALSPTKPGYGGGQGMRDYFCPQGITGWHGRWPERDEEVRRKAEERDAALKHFQEDGGVHQHYVQVDEKEAKWNAMLAAMFDCEFWKDPTKNRVRVRNSAKAAEYALLTSQERALLDATMEEMMDRTLFDPFLETEWDADAAAASGQKKLSAIEASALDPYHPPSWWGLDGTGHQVAVSEATPEDKGMEQALVELGEDRVRRLARQLGELGVIPTPEKKAADPGLTNPNGKRYTMMLKAQGFKVDKHT